MPARLVVLRRFRDGAETVQSTVFESNWQPIDKGKREMAVESTIPSMTGVVQLGQRLQSITPVLYTE